MLLQPKVSPQHVVDKVTKMHPLLSLMLLLEWQDELQKVTSQKVLMKQISKKAAKHTQQTKINHIKREKVVQRDNPPTFLQSPVLMGADKI